MRIRRLTVFILALGLLTSFSSVAQGADVQETQQDAIGQTPPRLSLTKGEVSFWRTGAEDWSQAQVNTPLAPGDQLYTGPQGNLEIQIGSRAFVRGGPNTQLGFESLEPDFVQFKVTAGNASFDLRTVEPGRIVEVDTPNAVITIEHAGYYRVDVSDERTSFITRRRGQATVTSAGGQSVSIAPSENVVIQGNENPQVFSYAAPQLDEWDKWNYARTDHLLDAVSARYVSPGVYGVDDLDRHGTWRSVPTYGQVWVPRGVAAGWAPYSTGSWVFDPHYGWTWVDTEPWGWAPYHYGRWVHVDGFWAWAPGPIVVRPAYSPALVAFYGGSGVGINVRIGSGPLVGWVALGWGEPCVPWWGPAHIRHRPWWGGWGGPRVVNNRVIHQTTIVNVQEINVYRNASVRNGVVAVHENRFGRGPISSARVTQVNERNLQPIRTAPQLTATPASLVPKESRGIRPPTRILERPVVASRPPRPKEVAAVAEQKAAPARVPTPAPRIVSVPQQRERDAVSQRAPFGQSNIERRTNDRTRPPAPPRFQGQRRPGESTGSAPSVTRQAPPQRQSEPQVTSPSATTQQPTARPPDADRTQTPAPPAVQNQKRPERATGGTPSVTRQSPQQGQREPQVTAPSPARPQPSVRPPEADRARPAAPPAVQSQKRPERATGGTPSVTRQSPQQGQREPQVSAPSPARPQSSVRPPEADRARPAAPPAVQSQKRPEQTNGGAPSATRQAPQQGQREPQVTAPSHASPKGGAEAARPSARGLPGEPANRLSPRGGKSGQQQKERG